MHPFTLALLLLNTCAGVFAQTSTVTVTSPGHSPAASLVPVNNDFFGLSIEARSWPEFTGSLSNPNNFSLNLFQALSSRVGTLPIRLGAGSGNNLYYDPSQTEAITYPTTGPQANQHVVGPSYADGIHLVNNSIWIITIPLLGMNLTNSIEFANLVVNAMPPGTFEAFEIGQEVDLYPNTSFPQYGSPYSPTVYAKVWKAWTANLTAHVPLPSNRANFWALSLFHNTIGYPPEWELIPAYNAGLQNATGLRAISQHYYYGNPSDGTASYTAYLLNHTNTAQSIDFYASDLSFLEKQNVPLLLGEVGLTVCGTCGTTVNIGLGAAIWDIDMMLHSMSKGYQRVNFEYVAGGQLAAWNPTPSSSYNQTIFGPFYAQVFIADLFAITPGTLTVSEISTSDPDVVAYGTYDGGLIHTIVVLNEHLYLSGGGTRPTTQITLTGFPDVTSVTAQYLSGPAADVYIGLSWAGQTWSNVTGLPGPGASDTQMYTVSNGAVTIPLLASQAVRVTLSRQ